MAEYLTPGIYIEEIDIGSKPIEGVSTSTAGFVGQAEKGPLDPRLITSFEQFSRTYGGYIKDSYLAYAVDGFFRNGGSRCYIARVIGSGAKKAKVSINSKSEEIEVVANGPGLWGNNIKVAIEKGTLDGSLIKLTVYSGKSEKDTSPSVVEVFDNLSVDLSASNYCMKMINEISDYVTINHKGPKTPTAEPSTGLQALTGGTEGDALAATDFSGSSNVPGERTGLDAFNEIDDISIVCIPDEDKFPDVLHGDLVTHCERRKDRFAILQAAKSSKNVATLRPSETSKYAAYYYPWIKILDPLTGMPILIPPGGHVAGVYARVDQEKGVHKAPANEAINGVMALEFKITKGEQDVLNPKGVNCIRAFPGRGILIWGARTSSSDPAWKYVNVRRLFIFVEKSIEAGTQWAVFEPNDEKLWARVKQTISQFLTGVWRSGALMGATQDEAFFVKCDRTTMTQSDIDNGRLVVVVGIAPVKPAEFVIFRIAQVAKGSEISE